MNAKIIALLIKLGVLPADKVADVTAAIEALPADEQAKKPDVSAIVDPAMREAFASLQSQLSAVVEMNKQLTAAMSAETKAREDAQKTIEAQQKTDAAKKIADAVALALTEGRISAAQKDDWTKSLESNFNVNSKILSGLAVNPALKKAADQSGATQKTDQSKQSADGKTSVPTPIPGPIGRVNSEILSKVMQYGNVQPN